MFVNEAYFSPTFKQRLCLTEIVVSLESRTFSFYSLFLSAVQLSNYQSSKCMWTEEGFTEKSKLYSGTAFTKKKHTCCIEYNIKAAGESHR